MVHKQEAERVGIREFRENLSSYLENGKPLAITRHGETLGFFVPAVRRDKKAEIEALRAASRDLDAMIAEWGATEEELMDELKVIRQESRNRKRNGR